MYCACSRSCTFHGWIVGTWMIWVESLGHTKDSFEACLKNHIVHIGGAIQYLFHIRYGGHQIPIPYKVWGAIRVIDRHKLPTVDSNHEDTSHWVTRFLQWTLTISCPCPWGLQALIFNWNNFSIKGNQARK